MKSRQCHIIIKMHNFNIILIMHAGQQEQKSNA